MDRIFCSRNRSNFAVGKFYFYEPFGHLHRIIYKMITKGGSDIKNFDDIKKMPLSGKELEAEPEEPQTVSIIFIITENCFRCTIP